VATKEEHLPALGEEELREIGTLTGDFETAFGIERFAHQRSLRRRIADQA